MGVKTGKKLLILGLALAAVLGTLGAFNGGSVWAEEEFRGNFPRRPPRAGPMVR